ncbi:hypothetical protein Hamer_G014390, partial [Homarus americanus]
FQVSLGQRSSNSKTSTCLARLLEFVESQSQSPSVEGPHNKNLSPSMDETKEIPNLPQPDLSGTRAARERVQAYKSRERARKASELDQLCAAAQDAHAGLRLYLLITTQEAPSPGPPTPAVVHLLTNRNEWLHTR